MDLGLAGKRAIVTGASKGIGLAVVRGLVAEGAHVIAGARTITSDLSELVDAGSVEFVAVDLAEADAADLLVAAAGTGVDILVNNVGLPRRGWAASSASRTSSGTHPSTSTSWPPCA